MLPRVYLFHASICEQKEFKKSHLYIYMYIVLISLHDKPPRILDNEKTMTNYKKVYEVHRSQSTLEILRFQPIPPFIFPLQSL